MEAYERESGDEQRQSSVRRTPRTSTFVDQKEVGSQEEAQAATSMRAARDERSAVAHAGHSDETGVSAATAERVQQNELEIEHTEAGTRSSREIGRRCTRGTKVVCRRCAAESGVRQPKVADGRGRGRGEREGGRDATRAGRGEARRGQRETERDKVQEGDRV